MRRLFAFLLVLTLATGAAPAAAAPESAALALVFATDVSGSVTPDSYLLQMDGIAGAFEDRHVLDALRAAPGGIEALVLQWSSPRDAVVSVPWTRVADADSASRFALLVRHARRSSRGLTAIGSAILAAARQFDDMPLPATRRVIDVSGDGMANFGVAPSAARDAAVKAGITINGLAVLSREPWLAGYYRREVIGGPASFVLAARGAQSFARAMRRKLALEIAGVAGFARSGWIRNNTAGRLLAFGRTGHRAAMGRAQIYREKATRLRQIAGAMRSAEGRIQFLALAQEFERLAARSSAGTPPVGAVDFLPFRRAS